MITFNQMQESAKSAEADTVTFSAQELHKENVLGGPNQVAEFHVFKKDGFKQGISSFNLGGADVNRIHDRLAPFTKDINYHFTQLDPHIRLRLEENHKELTPKLMTAVLTAVATALGGVIQESPSTPDPTPSEPEPTKPTDGESTEPTDGESTEPTDGGSTEPGDGGTTE